MKLAPNVRISKEQFLIEHNKLSPANLQVTIALLTSFQQEKMPNLKDTDWSHKLRIPLISWLNALPPAQEKKERRGRGLKEQAYKIYPSEI